MPGTLAAIDEAAEVLYSHSDFHKGAFNLYRVAHRRTRYKSAGSVDRDVGSETSNGPRKTTPTAFSAELLRIRQHAGLSQPQLAKALGVKAYNDLSKYKRDVNESSLMTLLAYSRLAKVRVEELIDDDLNLEI